MLGGLRGVYILFHNLGIVLKINGDILIVLFF